MASSKRSGESGAASKGMLIFMGAAAVVVAGLLIGGLVTGVLYFWKRSPYQPPSIQPAAVNVPKATPTPSPSPTATPRRRRR